MIRTLILTPPPPPRPDSHPDSCLEPFDLSLLIHTTHPPSQVPDSSDEDEDSSDEDSSDEDSSDKDFPDEDSSDKNSPDKVIRASSTPLDAKVIRTSNPPPDSHLESPALIRTAWNPTPP